MAAGQTVAVDAYVTIEYSGSTFNVSGDSNRAALNRSAEAPEATTFGAAGNTRQRLGGGLKDWSFALDAIWNDTETAGSEGIDYVADTTLGNQVVLTFGPAGSDSGYRKYSGSGVVTVFNVESPVDGVVTAAVEVQASSGSLTKSTF